MHGLINRSIQQFVCCSHGRKTWETVARSAGLDFTDFESMMPYKEVYTHRLLAAICDVLDRPRGEVMEDLGAFLVTSKGFEAVRRLLRFGGEDFVDFLHSLDDLADSVRLAVADLDLPKVELDVRADNHFELVCDADFEGYGYVMLGVLRAMADDYGALAVLEHAGRRGSREVVNIMLVENDFAEGRAFDLAAGVG